MQIIECKSLLQVDFSPSSSSQMVPSTPEGLHLFPCLLGHEAVGPLWSVLIGRSPSEGSVEAFVKSLKIFIHFVKAPRISSKKSSLPLEDGAVIDMLGGEVSITQIVSVSNIT